MRPSFNSFAAFTQFDEDIHKVQPDKHRKKTKLPNMMSGNLRALNIGAITSMLRVFVTDE